MWYYIVINKIKDTMIKSKKSLLSLILCVAFLCASFLATLPLFRTTVPAYATEKSATWVADEQDYADASNISTISFGEGSVVTGEFGQNGGQNAPVYSSDIGSVINYYQNTFTVTVPENYTISKIEFAFSDPGEYTRCNLVVDQGGGSYTQDTSSGTWLCNGSELNNVVFRVPTSGKQVNYKRMDVTYCVPLHEHACSASFEQESATCTTAGHKPYYKCECGLFFEDVYCTIKIGDADAVDAWKTEGGNGYLAPLGHDSTNPDIVYDWNGQSCTAKLICGRCHTEIIKSETKTAEYVKDSNATCTKPEKGHYEVIFNDDDFLSSETEKNSVTNGNPLGHTDVENAPVVYSWGYNGENICTASKHCQRCNIILIYKDLEGEYVRDTEPTYTDNAKGHYTVTFTEDWVTEKTQNSPFASVEEPNTRLKKEGLSTGAIIGISVGGSTIIVIGIVVYFILRKRKK